MKPSPGRNSCVIILSTAIAFLLSHMPGTDMKTLKYSLGTSGVLWVCGYVCASSLVMTQGIVFPGLEVSVLTCAEYRIEGAFPCVEGK
ncbi:hypothetical protein F4824DRAFT_472211 [Ustulina deusta]|nr:hypothetical protein F4824DRAFT_472211 [Ustulina deusta]